MQEIIDLLASDPIYGKIAVDPDRGGGHQPHHPFHPAHGGSLYQRQ